MMAATSRAVIRLKRPNKDPRDATANDMRTGIDAIRLRNSPSRPGADPLRRDASLALP
jgi:hypothetical protein